MKVIKYIVFVGIAVTLWITEPIWMPKSKYYRTTQEAEKKTLSKIHDQELKVLEAKFGKKSSVIPLLKKHWDNTYIDFVDFEWLKCSEIRAGKQGWTTVCTYRIQGFIRKNTYIINNGQVSKQN